MAISDKITSITGHLEDDYTALEQLGVSVEDRNIENIKDMANQIYAKFPKTDYAEGSNITLSNTLKGKLDFEDGIVGYGQTSQKIYQGYQLIPYTLATLKAINTVGTWNNNVYTYNGIAYTIEEENGYIKEIKTTGTATSNSILALISTMDIDAGTYYLSGCPNGGSYSTYFIYSGPGLAHNVSETPTTITFNEDTSLSSNNMRITILSGTSLSNLIWKPMLSKTNTTDYEPYVGGTASPNPLYPQEIEVVRGKNRLKFKVNNTQTSSGITAITNVSSITLNGTSNAQVNIACEIEPIKVKGTYKLSGYTRNDNYVDLYYKDSGGTIKLVHCKDTPTITFNEGDTLFEVFIYIANGTTATFNNETFNLQLEKGSQATSYLPYNTLEVVERGKNLFEPVLSIDGTNIFVGSSSSTQIVNGEFSFTASGIDLYFGNIRTAGQVYEKTRGIKIYRNGNQKISFRCTNNLFAKNFFTAYDKNDISLGFSQISSNTGTYTFPSNCEYVTFRFGYEGSVSGTTYTTGIMVAYGDEIPTYEPYQTPQTYQLSLGEYEFAKIGNYVDTIEYDVGDDKVYKNENVNEHIFTENENISLQSINSYGIANFFISHSLGSVSNLALCNYFSLQTSGISVTQEEGFLWQHNGVYFRIKSSTASDVNSFKTWLGSHSVKVEYALAETSKEEITGTLKDQIKALYNSHSFTGTTIIEIDGQLPLIIKVRALKGE